MKYILILSFLAASLGGCVLAPGYDDNRGGYYHDRGYNYDRNGYNYDRNDERFYNNRQHGN